MASQLGVAIGSMDLMGTYISFILRGYNMYNPYFEGLKPSCFMVLGSKGMVYVPTSH